MDLQDDFLRIETPEYVTFDYEIAGLGSRFLAALVDTVIITLLQIMIAILALAVLDLQISFSDILEGVDSIWMWALAVIFLFIFLIYWGYYIFFETLWNGQSPGKRWVGLRVIRADGTPITLTESAIRNLVRMVDLLPSFYGVGVVVMFVDSRSRRLGDLAAGTLVVHEKESISMSSLDDSQTITFSQPRPLQPAHYALHLLDPDDLQLAEDFLRRREELLNRQQLAARIALSLCRRLGLPEERARPSEAEKFIEDIVRASRDKQSR